MRNLIILLAVIAFTSCDHSKRNEQIKEQVRIMKLVKHEQDSLRLNFLKRSMYHDGDKIKDTFTIRGYIITE